MEQDWEQVVFKKSEKKEKNPKIKISKERKLENSEEIIVPKKTDFNFKKSMQQARMAKKLTQKELAQKIGIQQSEIVNYENGKKVPTNGMISKMEKILGCKLPRIK
tara:strand:+ start:7690 stop:8007 length:318 start_codon:yes stop_codon:yes gene_type:complete